MENLITITIRSTNYYLIETPAGRLMVDAGWANALPELKACLRRYDLDLRGIAYLMITHNHPDHAGLAEELKIFSGAKLILHEIQLPYLTGSDGHPAITVAPGDIILPAGNRAVLHRVGIHGEVVPTPGHSDDSVSLVLDSGMAFTGDLHPPELTPDEARPTAQNSWDELRRRGVKMVYPAHGEPFELGSV